MNTKIIIVLFLTLASLCPARAQENFAGAGVIFALPVSNFKEAVNFGYGISGTYEVGINKNFAAFGELNAVYYNLNGANVNLYHIPVQAGIHYYFKDQRESLFAGVKAGAHIILTSVNDKDYNFVEKSFSSGVNFSFAPEIGYFFSRNISISASYQFISAADRDIEKYDSVKGVYINSTTKAVWANYVDVRLTYIF